MPTRFDIERAVVTSGLLPPSRHLVHVLCRRIDATANLILPRWQPSLSELARETGYDRRTITRHLAKLEAAGWIIRVRPSLHDARTKHRRTAYTPIIPAGYPQGSAVSRARGTEPQGLGAQNPNARGTAPRKISSESSMSGAVTPAAPNVKDLCVRCGQPGHTGKTCER